MTLFTAAFLSSLLPFSIPAICQQPSTGSIHGTVKLQDTGGPAAGAKVTLFSVVPPFSMPQEGEYVLTDEMEPKIRSGTVDAAGSFEFGDVPPGEYQLMFYKDGYVVHDPRQPLPSIPLHKVRVLPGTSENVDAQLGRSGSIEGRVTFSGGSPPVTGQTVIDSTAVNVEVESAPGKFVRFGGTAHTDAGGHYRLDGLPTGRYVVFAAMAPHMVSNLRGKEGAGGRIIFAPGSMRKSQAEIVEVRQPNTSGNINIEFPTQGLHVVAGTVVDQTDAPVTKGLVRLYPSGESDVSLTVPAGIHGEFSFADLPADHYSVGFESEGTLDFVGMTEDKKGMRYFVHKGPFAPLCAEVEILDQNPAPLVLRARPSP